jgi:hypothetical protein
MKHAIVLALLLAASPTGAQNFTTAAEVKPIVGAIKGQWIAVRLWDGQDLLYFTNLLSWRCGLSDISYAINGGAAQTYAAEPCHEDTAAPNALTAEDILPYLSFAPNSIESVDVTVTYDDGTQDSASYQRAAVQID